MIWHISNRADPAARILADRHYNRQKPGTPQFVPPGRCLVLYTENKNGKAFWVTSFPYAEYAHHAWAGAWVCSAFRNEGAGVASEMIRDAVAATRAFFCEPPEKGMITFINPKKVRPTMRQGQKTWGRIYELAGFTYVGKTKGGLLAYQLRPADMPNPEDALEKLNWEEAK